MLDRNDVPRGHASRWTREKVTALRSGHRIPVRRTGGDGGEPWLEPTHATAAIGVGRKTLRLGAKSANSTSAAHPDGHPGLRPNSNNPVDVNRTSWPRRS